METMLTTAIQGNVKDKVNAIVVFLNSCPGVLEKILSADVDACRKALADKGEDEEYTEDTTGARTTDAGRRSRRTSRWGNLVRGL